MTVVASQASSLESLTPDTIVNVSGEDGSLSAATPLGRPRQAVVVDPSRTARAVGRPTADVDPTLSLPLPAIPGARQESLVFTRPDEPTLMGLEPPPTVADAPVRFKIRLANEQGIRSKASYLINKMYSWRGYAASGPKPAPNRVTLVASDAQRALATITIGFDGPEGLVVDDLYREEVDVLRREGAVLCEFTKLAVDRDQQSKELLAMMFHIAYMYARRMQSCTDLLIEVNPRHVRFYQRMLGFRQLGPERSCPRVGGAPAVLLWLRLKHAHEQIAQYGGRKELASQVRSLYPLFFAPQEEDGIVGRLKAIG